MAKTTTRRKLPYPEGTDAADVPLHVGNLAKALDNFAIDDQGTVGSLPAAGESGRYYYATDTHTLYRDNGSAWVAVDSSSAYETVMSGSATIAPSMSGSVYLTQGGTVSTTTETSKAFFHFLYEKDHRLVEGKTEKFKLVADLIAGVSVGKTLQLKLLPVEKVVAGGGTQELFLESPVISLELGNPTAPGRSGLKSSGDVELVDGKSYLFGLVVSSGSVSASASAHVTFALKSHNV